jgi:hypothetical protein
VDPPLCSKKQTPEYVMETAGIASQKEIQNSTISRKIVDTFLGHTRVNFGTLPR